MTKPYRPSNGSEGEWFQSKFCDLCRFDAKYRRTQDGKDGCKILANVYAYNIDHPDYPKEWIEDDGGPRCTKFGLPLPRSSKVKKHRAVKGQATLL